MPTECLIDVYNFLSNILICETERYRNYANVFLSDCLTTLLADVLHTKLDCLDKKEKNFYNHITIYCFSCHYTVDEFVAVEKYTNILYIYSMSSNIN